MRPLEISSCHAKRQPPGLKGKLAQRGKGLRNSRKDAKAQRREVRPRFEPELIGLGTVPTTSQGAVGAAERQLADTPTKVSH
jgi:hypothetical protein